jgi:hypothetical protein
LKLSTILVSKLITNSMRNAWALLGTLPVLGLCLLLGGVSGLVLARGVLAILAVTWLSLMVGLEQSCRNQGEHEAFSRGLRVLLVLNLIPLISPASLVLSASSVGSPFWRGYYWVTLGVTVFAGFQFWSLAKSNLAKNWQEQQVEEAEDSGRPAAPAPLVSSWPKTMDLGLGTNGEGWRRGWARLIYWSDHAPTAQIHRRRTHIFCRTWRTGTFGAASSRRPHRLDPRPRQQFTPDHVQVVAQHPVAHIAQIARQPHVQTTIQSVMFQTVDLALHRAVLAA